MAWIPDNFEVRIIRLRPKVHLLIQIKITYLTRRRYQFSYEPPRSSKPGSLGRGWRRLFAKIKFSSIGKEQSKMIETYR